MKMKIRIVTRGIPIKSRTSQVVMGLFLCCLSAGVALAQKRITVVAGNAIPQFEVTSIDPPEPIENQPIRIFFTVTNKALLQTLIVPAGSVTLAGKAAGPSGGRARVGPLRQNQTVSLSLMGVAPTAGSNAEIGFAYWVDPPPGKEVFQPTFEWSYALPVAAQYELRIDNVTIDNPRSTRNDTLNGEATALYGENPLPNPDPASPFDQPGKQIQKFSPPDRGAGSIIPTHLHFGPFRGVPGQAPPIKFSYVFANEGFSGSSEEALLKALNGLSEAGKAIATFEIPQGTKAFDEADGVHKKINGALLSSCDGVVAADQVLMNSEVLDTITKNTGFWSENRAYTGTSSPVVCGITSHYHVRFTVVRTSFQ